MVARSRYSGVSDQRLVGGRIDGDGLLNEAKEQLAAAARAASVEPEGELVEVVVQMFVRGSAARAGPGARPHIGLVHFDPAGEAIVAPDSLVHTDGWPGYDSLEHHGVVPSDVVGDEPEDGGERLGVAADVGSAQLQDRLDVVAVEVERGRLGRIRLRRLLDASGPSLTAFVQDAGCWAPITRRTAICWGYLSQVNSQLPDKSIVEPSAAGSIVLPAAIHAPTASRVWSRPKPTSRFMSTTRRAVLDAVTATRHLRA